MREALGRTVDILGARIDVRTRILGPRPRRGTPEGDDRPDEDKTMSELIRQAATQANLLARAEVRQEQVELREAARKARPAIVLLCAAGLAGIIGAGALAAMLVLLLAPVVGHGWAAALVVALVLFGAAGVLTRKGKRWLDAVRETRLERSPWT